MLCAGGAAALAAAGASGLSRPALFSPAFGLSRLRLSGEVFARAAGARDLAIAAMLGAAALRRSNDAMAAAAAACVAVSAADFFNAYEAGGGTWRAHYAVHVAGAAYFAVAFGLALAAKR